MSSRYSGSYSIPKELAARPDLNDGQKLLLGVVASLSTPERPCDCTHAQFADRLGHSRVTIARWLAKMHALGYVMVCPRLLPIARDRAHSVYHLPVRIWRSFYRAWAMVGPKWRKLAKRLKDWVEPWLPLELLQGIPDVERRGSRRSTDSLHRIKLTEGSVRRIGPEPGPPEQLSFQLFESHPVEETLLAIGQHNRRLVESWGLGAGMQQRLLGVTTL